MDEARGRGRLVAALAGVLLGVGCGQGPGPPPAASPAPVVAEASPPPRIFYLGRIPFFTASEVVRGSDALMQRLAKPLGCDRVVMVLAPDYGGVLDLLVDGKVDAAWLSTEAFKEAGDRKLPVEAVALPTRYGRTWYEGVVIARADSGILAVKDLKGRRVAFVDRYSSSGYAAPRRLLEGAGLKVPGDFVTRVPGEPDFLARHDNVVQAVYFGRVDAGAVYAGAVEDTFAQEPAKAAELAEIARTGRIMNEPVVVRADLPPARKKQITEAFLGLTLEPDEQHIFAGAERFVPYGEGSGP